MNRVLSAADQVKTRLRAAILTEELAPGQRLREEHLAEQFATGRAVVREALRELVREGLLVAKMNCGVSVAPAPNGIVKEALTPVRRTLECCALRHWHPRRREEEFAAWERVLAAMAAACRAGNRGAVIDADIEFHELLFRHAGLEELLNVWRPVMLPLRAYHLRRNARHPDEELAVVHEVHVALLRAFRGANVERAARALASHVTDGTFNLRVKRAFYRKQQAARAKRGKGEQRRSR